MQPSTFQKQVDSSNKHEIFTEEIRNDKMALQKLSDKQKKPPVGCYHAGRG